MRKPFLHALILALAGAAVISWAARPMSVAERVTRIEAEEALPQMAERLRELPVEINAVFLAYAGDRELVLNGRLALLRYPDKARTVLALYGTLPAFKAVFRHYGPTVIPPIHYFLTHDWLTLLLRREIAGWLSGDEAASAHEAAGQTGRTAKGTRGAQGLTPIERGRYAIGVIRDQGHDFLGQFVLTPGGEVAWLQSERVVTVIKRFLTSGITSLESEWRRGEELSASDYAWAVVDLLAPIAVFKAAKVAKAARATKLARGGRLASRTAKSGRAARIAAGVWGVARAGAKPLTAMAVLGAGGYLMMHPSVLTSVADGVAAVLGLPAWPVRLAVWFAVLLPLLLLARLLYRWIFHPTRRLLGACMALGRWVHHRTIHTRSENASPSTPLSG